MNERPNAIEMHPTLLWVGAIGASLLLSLAAAAFAASNDYVPSGDPAPRLDSTLVQPRANDGLTFNGPLGVAMDRALGEIAVANTGNGRIEFFDLSARPRGAFTHLVRANDDELRPGLPRFLAYGPDGSLYVSDQLQAGVDVCDYRGRVIRRLDLPSPDDSLGAGGGAGAIAVAPDGRVFVASRGREGRVHVFAPDGRHVATWGSPGTAPGQLSAVSGLALLPGDEVAITCVATELGVQIFTADGAYLRGFGRHDIGPGNFSQPTGIVATPNGRLWVTDAVRQDIQVFESSGTLVNVLAGDEGPGSLFYPSALASDGRGLFALTETSGNRFRLMWVR